MGVFDGVLAALNQAIVLVQRALVNTSDSWGVQDDGTILHNGVPVNIDTSKLQTFQENGTTADVKVDEQNRMKTWHTLLADNSTNIQQIHNEIMAARQAALTEASDLATEYDLDSLQASFQSTAALQARMAQELQDLITLLNGQKAFDAVAAKKLAACSPPPGPSGTPPGPAGPPGPGPAGTPPGPAGTPPGPSGPGGIQPIPNAPSGGPAGPPIMTVSNPTGTQSSPSYMPMVMPGMGGMGGMPLSGINGLGTGPASGASGPQGNTELVDHTTGGTGPKGQDVSASSTDQTKPGAITPGAGNAPAMPASAPTMAASSLRSVGSSVPAGPNIDAKLSDGTATQPASTQAAAAARGAQNPTTSADGGQQAGVALPPLGAPGLRSGQAGGRDGQRRKGVEGPSGDDDQDRDRSQRQ